MLKLLTMLSHLGLMTVLIILILFISFLYKNEGPKIYNTECVRIKYLNTTVMASNVYG